MRRSSLLFLTLIALTPIAMSAQGKSAPGIPVAAPGQIDPAEGQRVLESFRHARTEGDYNFSFTLVNRPQEGEESTYYGSMWGTWDENGLSVTRVDISLPDAHTLHMIYHGGPEGKILRSIDDGQAGELTPEERLAPMIEGLAFTPFDLQMPFIFWTDATYEGTKKLIGRPAHYFRLRPPANTPTGDIDSVRVAIDANFMALLFAEELGKDGTAGKSFRINDFAKKDGQWIIKELDLVNTRTKGRTRFHVLNARMGLELPPSLFLPDAEGKIISQQTTTNTQVDN